MRFIRNDFHFLTVEGNTNKLGYEIPCLQARNRPVIVAGAVTDTVASHIKSGKWDQHQGRIDNRRMFMRPRRAKPGIHNWCSRNQLTKDNRLPIDDRRQAKPCTLLSQTIKQRPQIDL